MKKNKTSNKKILHIVEAFGGGVYQIIKDLTNGLTEDYEIIIAYGKRNELPSNFKNDFNNKIRFVEIVNFTRNINMIKDFKALREVNKLIKNEKPDIVQLHSSKAGAIGRLANVHNIKMYYVPHGFSFLKQDDNILKRKIYWVIEKILAIINRKCTIVACSKGEYDEAIKLNKNSKQINNGILIKKIEEETKELKHIIDWNNITVCTVGRIDYQKNPKQFNEIAKEFKNVKFKWIGEGVLRDQLTEDNISITGWLDRKEVLKEVNDSDIFILTSLWEGMPVSLLEAMYMKKICIVSDVIGNRDVINDRVNGYIATNTEEFKKNVRNILNIKEEKVSENAYNDIIQKYNIMSMINKYKELYERK